MSQDEKETVPVSVIALRADTYLPDGNIVISLRTKFSSAERKYSVPIECFHDLVVDLQRLNASRALEGSEPLLPLEEPTVLLNNVRAGPTALADGRFAKRAGYESSSASNPQSATPVSRNVHSAGLSPKSLPSLITYTNIALLAFLPLKTTASLVVWL
jgi:hypothetical protein